MSFEAEDSAGVVEELDRTSLKTDDGEAPLLRDYTPLDASKVEEEMSLFRELEQDLEKRWEEECSKYEETLDVVIDGKQREARWLEVPRLNYLNARGIVKDSSLYPYHTSMYPLLDAYDPLYEGQQQPIEKNSIPPLSRPVGERQYRPLDGEEDYEVEGYTPASIEATVQTLIQRGIKHWGDDSYDDFFSLIQASLDHNSSYMEETQFEKPHTQTRDDAFWAAAAAEEIPSYALIPPEEPQLIEERYGSDHLPSNRRERSRVLLNLLKHSLSELQRDYRLASAVAARMLRHHDLDDISVLREFLSVCCSEYVNCFNPCDMEEVESPDHFCSERYAFDELMPQIMAFGLTYVTQQHASAMAAFVRFTFDREFGHLVLEPEEASVEAKQKLRLKRNALERRAEDDGDEEWTSRSKKKVPVDLVSSVIYALGIRGTFERRRLLAKGDDPSIDSESVASALDSFINCLRAVVDIGEACMEYLPKSDRFYYVASAVVRVLCGMLAETSDSLFTPTDEDAYEYLGRRDSNLMDKRLICPLRFADYVTNSTAIVQGLAEKAESAQHGPRDNLVMAVERCCTGRPHDDVKDVVRGLYVFDLVNVREAGCGYSDFLVWCRFDITPLDPAIFWYDYSFPVEEVSDDSDDEDEEEEDQDEDARSINWDVDEDGHLLNRGELRARYDFSLMVLMRAWHAPWTPESHFSFQPEFRSAARTVVLASRRLAIPMEVSRRIIQFLNREWWPEPRSECWEYDCQVQQVKRRLARKVQERKTGTEDILKLESVEYCPKCHVSAYCCDECRETDWKSHHKKFCNAPPHRIPGWEEDQIFATVMGESDSIPNAMVNNKSSIETDNASSTDSQEIVIEEGDDDDSWEDIQSDEENDEEPASRTKLIYKFFKDNTYTPRGIPGS